MASLLGARTLLVAPGIAISKDAISSIAPTSDALVPSSFWSLVTTSSSNARSYVRSVLVPRSDWEAAPTTVESHSGADSRASPGVVRRTASGSG